MSCSSEDFTNLVFTNLFFFPSKFAACLDIHKILFIFFDWHLSTTVLIFLHHVPCKSAIGNPRGQTETSLGQQKWDPGGKLSYVLFLIFATPSQAIIFRPRGHVHVITHRDLDCSRSLWIIKFPIKDIKQNWGVELSLTQLLYFNFGKSWKFLARFWPHC